MKGLILLLSISSIFAFESPVYRQEEWNNLDENARPQEQYFEGTFPTRIDHFQPLNQNETNFVSFLLRQDNKDVIDTCFS